MGPCNFASDAKKAVDGVFRMRSQLIRKTAPGGPNAILSDLSDPVHTLLDLPPGLPSPPPPQTHTPPPRQRLSNNPVDSASTCAAVTRSLSHSWNIGQTLSPGSWRLSLPQKTIITTLQNGLGRDETFWVANYRAKRSSGPTGKLHSPLVPYASQRVDVQTSL